MKAQTLPRRAILPGMERIHNRVSVFITGALLFWMAMAVMAGWSGVLVRWPRPAVQAILVVLTIGLAAGFAMAPSLRRWALGVDLRPLILLHTTRVAAGAWFLHLYARGELPYGFAA